MAEETNVGTMGSTDRMHLSDEMQRAIKACADYRGAVATIFSRIQDEYKTLNSGFAGKAATGFDKFYKEIVEKFFTAGETFDKYMKMYDDINNGLFSSIEKAFAGGEGIDPELGSQNTQMAGGTAEQK